MILEQIAADTRLRLIEEKKNDEGEIVDYEYIGYKD